MFHNLPTKFMLHLYIMLIWCSIIYQIKLCYIHTVCLLGPYYKYRTYYDMLNQRDEAHIPIKKYALARIKQLPVIAAVYLTCSYFFKLEVWFVIFCNYFSKPCQLMNCLLCGFTCVCLISFSKKIMHSEGLVQNYCNLLYKISYML